VALDAQLDGIIQVEVEQAAEREVVGALLGVGGEGEEGAVGLLGEELQGGLAAGLEGLHVVVAAREADGLGLVF
jgi:hypothetical protein